MGREYRFRRSLKRKSTRSHAVCQASGRGDPCRSTVLVLRFALTARTVPSQGAVAPYDVSKVDGTSSIVTMEAAMRTSSQAPNCQAEHSDHRSRIHAQDSHSTRLTAPGINLSLARSNIADNPAGAFMDVSTDIPTTAANSQLTCRLLTYLARQVDTRDVAGWQPLDIEAHYVSADGGAVSITLGAVESLRLVHGLPVRDIPWHGGQRHYLRGSARTHRMDRGPLPRRLRNQPPPGNSLAQTGHRRHPPRPHRDTRRHTPHRPDH